jgi:hypothetical protein
MFMSALLPAACATNHFELALHDRWNAGVATCGIELSDSVGKGPMFMTSINFKFDHMLLFAVRTFMGSVDVF